MFAHKHEIHLPRVKGLYVAADVICEPVHEKF